jgi:hypothetical protein
MYYFNGMNIYKLDCPETEYYRSDYTVYLQVQGYTVAVGPELSELIKDAFPEPPIEPSKFKQTFIM